MPFISLCPRGTCHCAEFLCSAVGEGHGFQGKLPGWLGRQLGSEYEERGMQRAAAVGKDLGPQRPYRKPTLNMGCLKSLGTSIIYVQNVSFGRNFISHMAQPLIIGKYLIVEFVENTGKQRERD